tara:strand:+ start:456 stop:620 length:165 start_codon:yes stop_codon:yes gene_type:complete
MNPLIASSPQADILFLLSGGFILLGSYFFGRLITFFFPKNPLIRESKQKKDSKN